MDSNALRLEDEDLFSDIPNEVPKSVVDYFKERLSNNNQKVEDERTVNRDYTEPVHEKYKFMKPVDDVKNISEDNNLEKALKNIKTNNPTPVRPLPSAYKYEILKRERALTDAQKAKVISAVTVGVCIVGATASFAVQKNMGLFNIEQVVQHELQSLTSFESMVIYFKDLGPLTTLLTAASAGAIVKYFKNSKKLKNAQHDMEDFSTAYMNYVDELGSDQIDRTR